MRVRDTVPKVEDHLGPPHIELACAHRGLDDGPAQGRQRDGATISEDVARDGALQREGEAEAEGEGEGETGLTSAGAGAWGRTRPSGD